MAKQLINGQVLYFDARYLRIGHHDGISRFSAGLITELHKNYQLVAIIYDERQLGHLPQGIAHLKLNNPTDARAELSIASKLNEAGAKLVYSPMQTMGAFGRKYKLALTLHDLIYYRHRTPPRDLNAFLRLSWRLFHLSYQPQRWFLNRADAVITVSQTTKGLIAKHRLTKRPVSVVYNAGSAASDKARKQPASKRLIYIGSFMPYKNVETLVKALTLLPDFELRLLSKISPSRQAELTALAGKSANHLVFLNGVSDAEYQTEIDNAFAMVTASREEGFGIPVIESMERGTPAVISDLQIFREIGLDAAHYFNQNSPLDAADKITALENKDAWLLSSKQSQTVAARFNWQESAEELVKALSAI